jgi:hypothetical protein
VLLLLMVAPVAWLCWRFVQMSDDGFARQVDEVQRFIELRDRARRELR